MIRAERNLHNDRSQRAGHDTRIMRRAPRSSPVYPLQPDRGQKGPTLGKTRPSTSKAILSSRLKRVQDRPKIALARGVLALLACPVRWKRDYLQGPAQRTTYFPPIAATLPLASETVCRSQRVTASRASSPSNSAER